MPDGGGGDGGQGRRSRRGGGGDPGEHGGVAVDAVEAELIAAGGAVGAAAGERGIVGGVATIADIVDAGGRHDPLGDARRGSEGPGAADGIQRELDSGGVEDAHHACPVTGRQARALEGEDIAAGEAELVEVDIARGADALAHGEPAVERQRQGQRGGERVAHVGTRAQRGLGHDRTRWSQGHASAIGGGTDHTGGDARWHGGGDDLLILTEI